MTAMVILGLGTNLEAKEKHLRAAVAALTALLGPLRCSPVYESRALLPVGAPEGWDMPYFNMAVRGETALAPHDLLAAIQAVEKQLGRVQRGHWAPREIDIDILALGDSALSDAALTIPHRELLKRDFALIPLADIAPDWAHPQAPAVPPRALAAQMGAQLKKTDIVIS